MLRFLLIPVLVLGVGVLLSGHIGMISLPPELAGLPVPMIAFGAVSAVILLAFRWL